jgi:hypothetical protein
LKFESSRVTEEGRRIARALIEFRGDGDKERERRALAEFEGELPTIPYSELPTIGGMWEAGGELGRHHAMSDVPLDMVFIAGAHLPCENGQYHVFYWALLVQCTCEVKDK